MNSVTDLGRSTCSEIDPDAREAHEAFQFTAQAALGPDAPRAAAALAEQALDAYDSTLCLGAPPAAQSRFIRAVQALSSALACTAADGPRSRARAALRAIVADYDELVAVSPGQSKHTAYAARV